MTSLHVVLLLAFGLAVAQVHHNRALWNLRELILCTKPETWPLVDYADYGCYCGYGGSGTPVDGLDRCCQTHDHCYSAAQKLPDCNPYMMPYSYKCNKANKTITCESTNNRCEMFVCECDRTVSECFAVNKYNKDFDHLPSEHCK
ncbi:phospholipase A2-like [Brachyhypopomus gauderio]|uniref:phospholipase A2-like n=1 Tax=Brachyhypopomus gauderio TaxID=698409 RepID=UPI0040426B0F